MTSLMTSLLRTAVDSRHIVGKGLFWRETPEKGPPPIAILHLSPPSKGAMSSWHVNRS